MIQLSKFFQTIKMFQDQSQLLFLQEDGIDVLFLTHTSLGKTKTLHIT